MKVLIDATPLLVRSAGIKNYLYHWIAALRQAAPRGAIATFPAFRATAGLDLEHSAAGLVRTTASLAALAIANHTPIPLLDYLDGGADLFHASSLVRHPPRRPRLTTTLHDVTSWILPELHPRANRQADRQLADNMRRAHRIIAVSEATRQDAVRVLRLPEEKIVTIHSGVADAYFQVTAELAERARTRYRLTRPFVLSVGTVEPRKNLARLASAFHMLPATVQDEFELVIAGPMGWADRETAASIRECRYLGYVPERDLPGLTAAATVLAYPSLYEGFGFPVAQAMAAGVPVLTSNVSALPEVAGDAAVLVDPRSVAEIRDGLQRLLLYPELRARHADRGRQTAARYRWEACAATSWQFFLDAAG